MQRTLLHSLTLLAVLLAAPFAGAANVYCYIGPSGQTDLYLRVEETAGSFVAVAIEEGAGGGKGRYYVEYADLVTAGLDTANDSYLGTVHHGTPSPTAEDPIAGFVEFGWTGSAEKPLLVRAVNGSGENLPDTTAIAELQDAVESVDTIADAIKVVSDKLATMLAADASNWKFTEDALQEVSVEGGGDSGASDLATEAIHTSRVFKLSRTADGFTMRSEERKTIFISDDLSTFAAEFAEDAGANQKIYSVDSIEIVSGASGGAVFGEDFERDGGTRAIFQMRGATAGDYTARIKGTYNSLGGPPFEGDILIRVKP